MFTVQAVTGIDAISPDKYGIRYFPNPASTTLTFDKLRIGDMWQTLEIRNVNGKQEIIVSARNKTKLEVPVLQFLNVNEKSHWRQHLVRSGGTGAAAATTHWGMVR